MAQALTTDAEMAVALLRQFAARLARERGVTEAAVRHQLHVINRTAVQIMAAANSAVCSRAMSGAPERPS